jgi:hypothetical protein
VCVHAARHAVDQIEDAYAHDNDEKRRKYQREVDYSKAVKSKWEADLKQAVKSHKRPPMLRNPSGLLSDSCSSWILRSNARYNCYNINDAAGDDAQSQATRFCRRRLRLLRAGGEWDVMSTMLSSAQ